MQTSLKKQFFLKNLKDWAFEEVRAEGNLSSGLEATVAVVILSKQSANCW